MATRSYATDMKLYIWVRREKEKGGMYSWEQAWLELDTAAGEVRLRPYGQRKGDWEMSLRPTTVTDFQVAMVRGADPSPLLALVGMLAIIIGHVVSRWASTPVLRIEQGSAPTGQRVVMIRSGGHSQLKETRQIAGRIVTLLRDGGSEIMMPDLSNDEPWRQQWAPTLIGVGLFILCIVVMIIILASYSHPGR